MRARRCRRCRASSGFRVDQAVREAERAAKLDHPLHRAVSLHRSGLRDETGSEALNPDNLVCRAMRAIKKEVPEIGILCDVALDPYTSHGHDGLLRDGVILNDETVAVLVKQALVQARSRLRHHRAVRHDGRPRRRHPQGARCARTSPTCRSWPMRRNTPPPSTARSATRSARPKTLTGDKRTYQMDPGNTDEALREVALDIEEGADMVMVKPGLPYLDIVRA